MFCYKCGVQLSDGLTFCTSCGTRQNQSSAPVKPASRAQQRPNAQRQVYAQATAYAQQRPAMQQRPPAQMAPRAQQHPPVQAAVRAQQPYNRPGVQAQPAGRVQNLYSRNVYAQNSYAAVVPVQRSVNVPGNSYVHGNAFIQGNSYYPQQMPSGSTAPMRQNAYAYAYGVPAAPAANTSSGLIIAAVALVALAAIAVSLGFALGWL